MTPQEQHHSYRKERHAAYVARTIYLDEQGYKTSERYDQWILTIAGGALGLSLTFLEKIAPQPAADTLPLLWISWSALLFAVLTGFMAIHLSRKSLYWERDKSQARFDQFDKTSTVEKMAGDPLTPEPNPHNASLSKHNHWSLFFLMFGLVTLCMFALINISVTKFPRGASNITTASATNNSSEPVISKLSVKTN